MNSGAERLIKFMPGGFVRSELSHGHFVAIILLIANQMDRLAGWHGLFKGIASLIVISIDANRDESLNFAFYLRFLHFSSFPK